MNLVAIIRSILVIVMVAAGFVASSAQSSDAGSDAAKASQPTLNDFAGRWKLDLEKSYSRNERRDVSGPYILGISLSGDTLRLQWDYTVKKRRSNFSETLIVDGKEHDFPQRLADWDAWSYKASFKRSQIINSLNYRTTAGDLSDLRVDKYLHERKLSLNSDKSQLTIVSIFRSTQRGSTQSETKKLVFVRDV